MKDKKTNYRGEGPGGSARNAYEDLKVWAVDELKPQMGKLINAKIKELANEHGTSERKMLQLLMRPPAGEARPRLVQFLYDAIFS